MALPVFDDATTLYFKGLQGTLPLKSSNTATVPTGTEANANVAGGELSFTKTLIWQWKAGDTNNFANNANGQIINGVSVIRKGGTVSSTSDGLQMGAGRWILGYGNNTAGTVPTYTSGSATTNAIYVTNAELDLSNPFKITVIYASATIGTGSNNNFYVYLNNDDSSGGSGVLYKKDTTATTIGGVNPPVSTGGAVVFGVNPETDLVLTTQASSAGIDKQAVLAHSFLQFRCESGISKMLITEIIIEPWATPNEPLATGVAISTTAESPITPETESGIDYQAEFVGYQPVTLTADFTPAGAAGEAITWSIEEATGGASVSDGKVSIDAAGTYTVKATSGAFSDTYKFKIHPAVSDVSISGAGSVNVGSPLKLEATVNPSEAVRGVTWSVSLQESGDASGVATIDSDGVLTGVAAGSVTVTATSVGKGSSGSPVTKTHNVTVQEASAVTGITISGANEVTVGLTPIQLTATVTPDNAVQDVTWSVDTSGNATIDAGGVLTGVAAGSVTVTATSVGNGASGSPVTATKDITVNARPAVTDVTINGDTAVAAGKSITLHATVTPTGTLQDVTWAVSLQGGGDASGVATIDSNGVLTGVAAGSVTVTATSVGKDSDESEVASQGYEVTVKAPVAENKTWVIMEYTDATALATAGLTLGAGVEKSDISSFSFDNVVYTNRIDFKGAWSSSNTTRYISFNVSGPCIIKALLNYNASRSLVLASTLGTNLLTAGPLTANGIYSFEYKGEASTLYLYIAGNGGLSLYKLSIEY
jgi:uncharacterized protein YjdB